ncbi:MAG: hypothetical protein WC734_00380 [Patescibacteria group bacterium]|jgi:hypothetical protein
MTDKDRKIYIVVATGGQDTDRHYFDTIKTKREHDEASKFLTVDEQTKLKEVFHDRPFATWGAVPGSSNTRLWENMEPGDYVFVYRAKKIILVAEIAMKVHNKDYARFLWREDSEGKTWELMYFLINEVEVDVPMNKLNQYLQYGEDYFPRGFMGIDQEKVNQLLVHYGDPISLLERIQSGQKPEEIEVEKEKVFSSVIDEKIERVPTEHDEMQWRLIRLGHKAHLDVWVPPNDQGKSYDGNNFREHVMKEFREALDIPTYIKNIDTVWKLGLSIKSAFEIENSTSIYSGILRLSDLRALAPNSNYPLFIVAQREKKMRVFEQLQRPTFANDYLQLDRTVSFLSYDAVRKLDEDLKGESVGFDLAWLIEHADKIK